MGRARKKWPCRAYVSLRKRTQQSGSLLRWGCCRVDGRGNNEIGLTKVLALEVAEHGITSNAICPADVRTPLVERQIKEPARQHQISRDDVIRKITTEPAAIHRLLDPEEVSAVVLYLCGRVRPSTSIWGGRPRKFDSRAPGVVKGCANWKVAGR